MAAVTLDGHFGRVVDLDICHDCEAIWFDHFENLGLAPGGTLKLFQMIGAERTRPAAPLRPPIKCPRCDARLFATEDRQRNTPFRYWRCPAGHGRLITYFDFLREKDFIRRLSDQQLNELRQSVQQVHCASCGAPIDLLHASACGHCGAPIATLDLKHIGRVVEELQQADARTRQPLDYDALFAAVRSLKDRERRESPDLLSLALQLVANRLQ